MIALMESIKHQHCLCYSTDDKSQEHHAIKSRPETEYPAPSQLCAACESGTGASATTMIVHGGHDALHSLSFWYGSTFMKSGPPVRAPSLPVVTTTRMPLLVPCSTVPYHFSTTLSPKAKASFSNSSFLVVTASSLYPVSVCTQKASMSHASYFLSFTSLQCIWRLILPGLWLHGHKDMDPNSFG